MRSLSIIAAILLGLLNQATSGEVTIDTTKDIYALGEPVYWTITNDTDKFIESNSIPPGAVVRVQTWEIAWNCVSLPGIHRIAPGVSETYGWNQIMCSSGEPAESGMYWALFSYWFEDGSGGANLSAAFCIDSNCGATSAESGEFDGTSWGRVKALYR